MVYGPGTAISGWHGIEAPRAGSGIELWPPDPPILADLPIIPRSLFLTPCGFTDLPILGKTLSKQGGTGLDTGPVEVLEDLNITDLTADSSPVLARINAPGRLN